MRKYETVFISDPDLQEQARTDLFEKVRNIITRENGIILKFDEWGNRKLAYEVRKKLRGHYVCLTYGGTGELVKELERNFRLSDDVMKYMTVLLSDDVTAEDLEKEAQEALEADAPAPAEDAETDVADAEAETGEAPAEAGDTETEADAAPAEDAKEEQN